MAEPGCRQADKNLRMLSPAFVAQGGRTRCRGRAGATTYLYTIAEALEHHSKHLKTRCANLLTKLNTDIQ